MIFKQIYASKIEDFTHAGELNLAALLRIFLNLSNAHTDFVGDCVFRRNLERVWILAGWRLEVERFPKYGEKITLATWTNALKSPFYSVRNFTASLNDEILAKAATKWVSFDVKTGKIAKISPEKIAQYGDEDRSLFSDDIGKFAEPKEFASEFELALRRGDIDFNGHVHNLNYLDFALEALPDEIYKTANFKNLRINYKSAIKIGDKVICKYANLGALHAVAIYANNKLSALVEFS